MSKEAQTAKNQGRKEEIAAFILMLQQALLQKAIAHWPRRTTRLLEINCGDGANFHFLWQSGFEIFATEINPDLRLEAQEKDQNIEIRAASAEDLPFDDDYFDWAILHIHPDSDRKILAAMQECLRVARRGIIFTFWNSASLPCLCWKSSHLLPWPANTVSVCRVWRLARSLQIGNLCLMTTLSAPFWCWRKKRIFQILNSSIPYFPIGAWGLARLDLDTAKLGTPLRLRLENLMTHPMPAMEYAEKNSRLIPFRSDGYPSRKS